MKLENEIENAEEELPYGYTIEISVSNDLGVTMRLEDDGGDSVPVKLFGLSLSKCVSKCIDAAIEDFNKG